MIRKARPSDIPRLVAMGERFIGSTSYRSKLGNNPAALSALMEKLVCQDDGLLMVSERDAQIAGMLGGFLYTQPMSGERIAGELFWWVDPEKRKGGEGLRLARELEAWGRQRQADKATLIAPTEDVARLCRALGYGELETHFQKDL